MEQALMVGADGAHHSGRVGLSQDHLEGFGEEAGGLDLLGLRAAVVEAEDI